jgi:hypothetical protein
MYLVLVFSPFLVIYGRQVPGDLQIEASYLNGMLAASGIFFALITSFSATRKDSLLPGSLVIMLLMDGALLFIAGGYVFDSAIHRVSPVSTMAWLTASFYANGYTALAILIVRFLGKSQQSST